MLQLSDHYTLPRLLRFTLPSVSMMVFTSVYLVIDGFFVSNYVGKTALAAVNMVYPIIMIIGSIGFMFGSGGSALTAAMLGEGENERAKKTFTLMYFFPMALGLLISIPAFILLPYICTLMGADGELLSYCSIYGRVLISTVVLFIVQMESQIFFVTAERPKLGLVATVLGCGTNIVLDWLFCAVFRWGIKGAAAATAISQAVGGLIPLLYFTFAKNNKLHFVKTKLDWKAIRKSASNGFSELLSNTSSSIVAMLFNFQLMRIVGEDGVAAYSVLMYVNLVFLASFIGFSSGSSPLISFNYGSENHRELKGLFKKISMLIIVTSVIMLLLSFILAKPLSYIFVGYDRDLFDMTVRAFYIYAFSFLFAGINIFASSFFTALNNGKISAILSFLRTFILPCTLVMILPQILNLDGIWATLVVAEAIAFFVSLAYLVTMRKRYHY
ncbi:MAG: MATE family efflux transporter [Candidatus Ornithospirochaeta sp.]